MVTHHLIEVDVIDIECVHHLLPGSLLMVFDERHDSLHPLLDRRVRRAAELLVILYEIHSGLYQLLDDFGGLIRSQTERWFDNRTDERSIEDLGEGAASSNAELRSRVCFGEPIGQGHADYSDPGESTDRVYATDHYRHQRSQIVTDRLERKCDVDFRSLVDGAS
ncbi:hypothetical protein AGR7B_pAt0258 [Agrobacterium deltaense RV3]|nr:hypothetical protein AGR7B_pAt0258 [Agrobacterium deltaense RV3]